MSAVAPGRVATRLRPFLQTTLPLARLPGKRQQGEKTLQPRPRSI